jgi:hypothetical protein
MQHQYDELWRLRKNSHSLDGRAHRRIAGRVVGPVALPRWLREMNKATWKADDDLLARTYVTAPSGVFESNRLKRLTSYPERYLADTALSLASVGSASTSAGKVAVGERRMVISR